ncbi:MAG TPA: hypothetical protein VIE67_07405 [Rudaea sp.]|uniref:hypothetical protein n=1 Tax=Rudaea sp. TaxID=2136325 RepID=UPI002F91EF2A
MKRHSLIRWSLPALVIAGSLLSGCSWFHRDRVDYYKGAQETRPLEVPPDLDTPSSSKELVVPGPGAASAPAAAGTTQTAPSAASPSAAASAQGADLHVADSVEHTWQRVGLALDRAQIGALTSRDEAGRSYTMDFNGTVTTVEAPPAPEHHWYARVLHPFGGSGGSSAQARTQQATSALRINVSEDNGGARVSVIGNANDKSASAAARRVIEVLRERMS